MLIILLTSCKMEVQDNKNINSDIGIESNKIKYDSLNYKTLILRYPSSYKVYKSDNRFVALSDTNPLNKSFLALSIIDSMNSPINSVITMSKSDFSKAINSVKYSKPIIQIRKSDTIAIIGGKYQNENIDMGTFIFLYKTRSITYIVNHQGLNKNNQYFTNPSETNFIVNNITTTD